MQFIISIMQVQSNHENLSDLWTVEFTTSDVSFNGVPRSFPSTAYEMIITESCDNRESCIMEWKLLLSSIVASLAVESSKLLDS